MCSIVRILLRQPELVAVNQTGETKISGSLNPKDTDFGKNLVDIGTHGIDADVGADTKSAGEKPRHALPGTGYA